MQDEQGREQPGANAVLEHLTGASRGRVTWLNGSALDVSLGPDCFIRVAESQAGAPPDVVVARLHRAGDSYEIQAFDGRSVWVNGERITSRLLQDSDMIEFCETGPVSRFCLCREDRPLRTTIGDILSDTLDYLRVSRQPPARRGYRALCQLARRLMHQTTVLFRITVILAILVLAVLVYQQNRMDRLLQQRIAQETERLESFAAALARARDEALTPNDLQALREELSGQVTSNAERLAALERRSIASGRVIAQSLPAVVFLQGSYGFREASSGRLLRQAVDEEGRPLLSPRGQPLFTLAGEGPVAERQFTGTGFFVGDGGALVTNRHVALPWESDANVEALAGQDLQPVMIRFIAYRPGDPAAVDIELLRASEESDLAVLHLTGDPGPLQGLRLADAPPASGDEVIVMGYPAGLRAMLAQAGAAFLDALQEAEDTDFWSVAERLAESGHIVPLASRGIVGQVTPATVVYDAETTHGGSGGPVLDVDGAVVAVNAAILPEFGGSNLGVPAAKVRALLEAAGGF